MRQRVWAGNGVCFRLRVAFRWSLRLRDGFSCETTITADIDITDIMEKTTLRSSKITEVREHHQTGGRAVFKPEVTKINNLYVPEKVSLVLEPGAGALFMGHWKRAQRTSGLSR